MPVYQYKDKYYDIAETDASKAKAYIQSKLGETQMAPSGTPEVPGQTTRPAGQAQPQVAAPSVDNRGLAKKYIVDPVIGTVEAPLSMLGYTPRTPEGQYLSQKLGQGLEGFAEGKFLPSTGMIPVPMPQSRIGPTGKEETKYGVEMASPRDIWQKTIPALGPAESEMLSAGLSAPRAPMTLPKMPKVGESIGEAVRSKLDPEKLDLAKKAADRGISIRPDMLTNNSVAKLLGDTLEKVPFSGAKDELRQQQFNRAIIDVIGGDATKTKLTSDVFSKAINQSGSKIGEISSKYDIPVNDALRSNLTSLMQSAEFETSDVSRIVNKYVDEISKHVDANNQINGETFRKIRSQLTAQIRRSRDGDLTNALSNLDEVMLDAVRGQLKPEELTEFDKVRKQYAYAKTIQPLVAKGTGDISASGLMNRVTATGAGKSAMAKGTAGDLGDIARIGQAFLNEPTAPLNRAATVLGEIGAGAVAPVPTAGVVGGANLYNRLGPSVANRLINPRVPMPAQGMQLPMSMPVSQQDLLLLNLLSRNQSQQ